MMETINFGAFLTFVFIATFTPGPNNISSSSMGILFGYRKTLIYILGMITGFFMLMFLAGIISGTLYAIFPALEGVMRLIGALYIIWLAYKTLKSSYQLDHESSPALGYRDGLLLQAVNPKLWVFALTLFSTFLAPITHNVIFLLIAAIFLTFVAFCATSTWAVFGALIKRYLHHPKVQRVVTTGLAILLLYTAVDISGVLHLLS